MKIYSHALLNIVLWMIPASVFFILPASTAECHGKTYIDELGRKVFVQSEPVRIVSMAPNITEILFSIGLDDKIVGVTNYCNYPAGALKKKRIGGFINPSLEMIIALKPDLVICTADGNRKETVMQLEKIGVPVYVTHSVDMHGFYKTLSDIGDITGRKRESRTLISRLTERHKRVLTLTAPLAKPTVFFQVGVDPITTVGNKTFINELIGLAGGRNIYGAEKTRYPRCAAEDVLTKDPAVIVIATMGDRSNYERARRYWQQWGNMQAVRNRRIHWIDPDTIDRFSPRVMDALEELTGIVHPQLRRHFTRKSP
ncbi:MAG: cobalamin-binding protein [Deltaproteobacteria bacterium]|nr:cobalamin-binding protein [Deltaproteobacteria bacterium]